MSLRMRTVVILLLTGVLIPGPAYGQTTCPEPSGSNVVENFCYDALGRLIEQTRNDGASASFEYDDAGNRTTTSVVAGSPNIIVVIIGGRPFPIVIP